ncbi:MAG TPA: aminotransferase class V-fold PLP-dependent enzyme [Nocardioidaceae bacterium]|nr:aminotransferase class V-fold PLP-dependent enzyme [Nocardioidaceae bacterium]
MDPRFSLDPDVVHLNHGAFGTVPDEVAATAARWRAAAEANPHRFHRVDAPAGVRAARGAAAAFVHAAPEDVALVRNVSEAVATVLHAVGLGPGDEILLSDHAQGGVRLAVDAACRRTGARAVEVVLPLDATERSIVEAFTAGAGPRTRLVLVDQITSLTATVMPVAAVAAAVRAAAPAAAILADAAHVPGHLDVDPAGLGVDFWAGNLYKWAFAPRGSAVLWVAPHRRPGLQPLVPSWGADEPFPVPWDHPGNQDWATWLAVPAALEFFAAQGGFEQVRRNSELVHAGQRHVAEALGTELAGLPATPAPCMRLVHLPAGVLDGPEDARDLYERLSTEHRIEVGPVWFGGQGLVRFSGQVYNDPGDYDRLADVLAKVCR